MSFKVENELLGRIKEVEKTLNFNFEKSLLAVNNKIKELITKVDSMSEKVETLDNNFNEIKVKGDKIDEFIVFKNKSLDQLTSHEIRINQLIADTSFMKTKYDKMFIDNFTVPGFVGEFCKYKTIRDYIESNIKEMSLINSFKEQSVVDIKNYGSKIENLIKQFTGSLDNFSDRQKETLNNAKREIYKKVNDEINKIDNKFEDVKIYNTNEAKKLSEKTDDLIKVTKETIDFRDRLKNYFEQNLDEITSDFDEIRLNVSDLNDEYNTIKDKFQEIIAFVREFNQRKYTRKEESIKKLRSFQRQKTVNLKNRKVDFIANDINNEKNEKSTKNLTIVVEKLEKETPLKKKKVGINQKIEIHETIEKPIEEKIKEEREENIEIEKASENNIFKKEDDEEEEEEIIKEENKKINEEEEERNKEEEDKKVNEEEEEKIKEKEEKRKKEEEEERNKEEEDKKINEEEEDKKVNEEEEEIIKDEEVKKINEEEDERNKEEDKKINEEEEEERNKEEEDKKVNEEEEEKKRNINNKKIEGKRGTNKVKNNITKNMIKNIDDKFKKKNNINKKKNKLKMSESESSKKSEIEDENLNNIKINLKDLIDKKYKKKFDKYIKNLKDELGGEKNNNENYNFNNLKKKHIEFLELLRKNINKLKLYEKAGNLNKAKNDLIRKIDDMKRKHDNVSNCKIEFFEIYYDLKKKKEEKEKKIKKIEKIIDKEGIFKSDELKLRNKMIIGFLCMCLYLFFLQ